MRFYVLDYAVVCYCSDRDPIQMKNAIMQSLITQRNQTKNFLLWLIHGYKKKIKYVSNNQGKKSIPSLTSI